MALARWPWPLPFFVGFGLAAPAFVCGLGLLALASPNGFGEAASAFPSWLWPMVASAFVLACDGLDLLAWACGGLGLIHSVDGGDSPAAFAAWSLGLRPKCASAKHLSRCRSVVVKIVTLPMQPKRKQHLA